MQNTEFIQWLVLALVQGLTEYLPVSSSAHLILVSAAMDWQDQGLVMDIAAHGGSLFAVMWYFKAEIKRLLTGQHWPLFQQLALASVPLALCGFLLADVIEQHLRSPVVIAMASIVFGVLLYASDKWQQKNSAPNGNISTKQALLIGFGQVFALIPGASRSGVTMTAAMIQGHDRSTAARFSFLLAIPALMMSSGYGLLKLYQQPQTYQINGVLVVTLISFLASMLSITVFMKLIERVSLRVFLYYRCLLGLLILWYLT